jgi:insulysin
MNMSANPEHPYHVACGNNKVLFEEPKERGVDLYDEMKKLYEATYSANGMTVCILGKESKAELEQMVREKFGPVVNKNVTMPLGDNISDKPPFLPKEWNQLLLQNPVQDVKELTFSWVIPFQDPLWKTKPTQYISHLLGYEGTGSVIAVLKQKGLISACSSGNGNWLEGAFSLLNVSFDLTDKGLSAIEEIGRHLFAFIGMLQSGKPEKWIFEEMQKLAEISFKFREDGNPFSLCPDIALSMQRLPASEALCGGTLLYEFDPDAIQSVLSRLTLESVRVQHQAKTLAERCTQKDTSYGSPMALLPIEPAWTETWNKCVKEGVTMAAELGLHLPKPNPFIPEDLSLKPSPAEPQKLPVLIKGLEPPVASLFHRQDDTFKQPKAQVSFTIYTPFMTQSARNYTLTDLWCRCVEEALQEFAYDAEVAGVGYSLSTGSGSLRLVLAGYNDKLHVLLDAVTEKITSMQVVPESVYEIVADAYGDDVRNETFHSPPYAQCGMRFSELTSRGTGFPAYQKLEAFEQIKSTDLAGLSEKIFAEGTHVEGLVLGNLVQEDAKQLASKLVTGLKLQKPLAILPERAEAELPAGNTLWTLDSTDAEDPNHAVFMRLQLPEGMENEMLMQLFEKVLSPKFFDTLRTQQQLGYIVQMGSTVGLKLPYIIAVIQTEFEPNYVRSRIDSFLEDHLKFVEETLTEEEFQVCRAGILAELKVKPKNLREEASRYARHINNRTYDFGRRERAIAFVENQASLETLRSFVREQVRAAPRIYNQVRKVMDKPDKALPEGAVTPKDAADLRTWTEHKETVKTFGASAKWHAISTAVEAAAKL